MTCYLLHHYKRQKTRYGRGKYVYYENYINNNICPYIFNKEFIHTFCKAFPLKKEIWNINFWINIERDRLGNIERILCDIVFFVWKVAIWDNANTLNWKNAENILWYMDSNSSLYKDHFSRFSEHPLKRNRRVTLFADPVKSFQAQDKNDNLFDIKPILERLLSKEKISELWEWLKYKRGIWIKNYKFDPWIWEKLYEQILKYSDKKIYWSDIEHLDPRKQLEINPKKISTKTK